MSPLKLQLKPKDLQRVRYLLGIEEPRVIRRANILNCLHLGYVSSDIAAILNVDPKTVTNVGNAYTEDGLDSALFDDERSGRPIDFDDRGADIAKKISDRLEIHYTPVHASWLNQAEIAIGMYSRQCLGDGRVGDIGNLKKMTAAWNQSANERATIRFRASASLLTQPPHCMPVTIRVAVCMRTSVGRVNPASVFADLGKQMRGGGVWLDLELGILERDLVGPIAAPVVAALPDDACEAGTCFQTKSFPDPCMCRYP